MPRDYVLLLSVLRVCHIPSPWSEVDSEGEPVWFPWFSSVLQMRQLVPNEKRTLKRAVSRFCYFSQLVGKDSETPHVPVNNSFLACLKSFY